MPCCVKTVPGCRCAGKEEARWSVHGMQQSNIYKPVVEISRTYAWKEVGDFIIGNTGE